MKNFDTIVAEATSSGRGGIGIVRMSGSRSIEIASEICGRGFIARTATYARFLANDGIVIDDGLVLCFEGPASFTGENVVELQGHGSPVVLQEVLARCRQLGARQARPGEFSERAFLNGKLDLAQAEAVADLIAAADTRAARAARRALDGEFSQRVDAIAAAVLGARVQVEALIDFSDEPIETLGGEALRARIDAVAADLAALHAAAARGRRLRDGLHAVIVGPPNAGKSSLLNALAGSDRAIVTDIAGTTRDLLAETVLVDGVALTLVDTAGLRDAGDAIEREGMRRARAELGRADLAIAVVDARTPDAGRAAVAGAIAGVPDVLWLHNKADLVPAPATGPGDAVAVSALTGAGLDVVRARLHALATGDGGDEGAFTARARQVEALSVATDAIDDARHALAAELLDLAAESLRAAHDALGAITGRVSADDLLGHVFATFCIGK